MVWRKRRRYRLANLVSYLCVTMGTVFIIGNVIMLRQGFVQLYVTAFGERTPLSRHELRMSQHGQSSHKDKWRENRYYKLPVMDIPHVELPSSALAAELRLRKLMNNQNGVGARERPLSGDKYTNDLDKDDIQYLRDTEMLSRHSLHGVSVISVSTRDLRRSLYVTSDCAGLQNLTDISIIGSGWTKVVYKTRHHGSRVAMKTIDIVGHDLVTCRETNKQYTLSQCYEHVVQKVLKEIILLRGLDHPHIIQLLSHCVPDIPYNGRFNSMVTMVTELGEGIDIIQMLHMSWEDRLRISYGLTKLLHFLAHSPYGSVLLTDFRRQQFVLVNGDIKLTDLDDMAFTERSCLVDADCVQHHSSTNTTLRSPCISRQCLGLNEKMNIFNAARHFTTFLLPYGAPSAMRPSLRKLVDDFSSVSKTAKQLLQELTTVVDEYSMGTYLNRTGKENTTYSRIEGRDMPGVYDYKCKFCMDAGGCTVSVYDVQEAEQFCTSDPQCQAFILTNKHSWTGRVLVHLKSGIGNITNNPSTTLYIRPTL